jgi:hypothetical protein
MKRVSMLAGVVAVIALAHGVAAMESPGYRLDWFTLLDNGGGGAAQSTHYAINLTVGQVSNRVATSAQYGVSLGYWSGAGPQYLAYLPIARRQ